MNFLGEAWNICKNGMKFSEEKYAINKLANYLRIISTFIIFLVLFLQYWNFLKYFDVNKLPLFEYTLRLFLHRYTFVLFVVWLTFNFAFDSIFTKIIIHIECQYKIRLLPLWNTIEDIFELSVSCLLVLFSLNIVIEFCNGIDILIKENKEVYWVIIFYFACGVAKWIYIKNSNHWYYLNKSYTDFFDTYGNRIAIDDKVIYNGKLYKVYCDRNFQNTTKNCNNWWLVDDAFGIVNKNVLLEEAVKDEKGKIKVYEYGMGEKDKKSSV
jgi:hypothetical protein